MPATPRGGFLCAFSILAISSIASSFGQESLPPVPADTCILELTLPAGTTVTTGGRDYGVRQRLTWEKLQPKQVRVEKVTIKFRGGKSEDHIVMLRGDRQRLRLAVANPDSRRPEIVLQSGHQSSANHSQFSRDGRYLLTASGDGKAILWDAATARPLREYRAHTESICAVQFCNDERRIMTLGGDDKLITWERDTGKILETLAIESVCCGDFSPDRNTLAIGDFDESTQLLDLTVGRVTRTWTSASDNYVSEVNFSPDSSLLATHTGDGRLKVVSVVGNRTLISTSIPEFYVTSLAIDESNRYLAASLQTKTKESKKKGYLRLWDLTNGKVVAEMSRELHCSHVSFLPNSDRLVSTWSGGKEKSSEVCFHFAKDLSIEQTKETKRVGSTICFDHPQKRLFDGGTVWNLAAMERLTSFADQVGYLTTSQFAVNAPSLFLNGIGEIIHFDLADSRVSYRMKTPEGISSLMDLQLSADGQRLVALGWVKDLDEKHLLAYQTSDGGLLAKNRISTTYSAYLSIDRSGNTALVQTKLANDRFFPVIWDVISGNRIASPDLPESHYTPHLSPNGKIIGFAVISGSKFPAPENYRREAYGDLQQIGSQRPYAQLASDVSSGNSYARANMRIGGFAPNGNVFTNGNERIIRRPEYQTVEERGMFALWDTNTGALIRKFRVRGDDVERVIFNADSSLAVSIHDDGKVYVWDVATGVLVRGFQALDDSDESIEISPDGRFLSLVDGGGGVHLLDVATGLEVVQLHFLNDRQDWLAITPQGLFDGTEEARKSIAFRIGGGLNVVPVERFFQDYYRPGLLGEIYRGERPLPSGEFADKTAPLVKVLSPQQGASVEQQAVQIEVEVTDRGGGIEGPWLMHNGTRIIARGERKVDGKTLKQTLTAALVEGENRFEIRAASSDGSWESEPALLVVKHAKPVAKPAVHLLAVGINQYKHESLNLKFAAPDANAMATLFQTRGAVLYGAPQVNVTQVTDSSATREGIEAALGKIAEKANPQDTLVVFLAGHGTTVGQRYYFIPHEFATKAEKLEDDIRAQGIAGDVLGDWVEKVPALKRVLIFDTCQSGGALPVARTARDPFAFRGALERLSHARGIFSIAASSANESAQEVPELKHGLLTYALLAGAGMIDEGPLANQAIRATADEKVVGVREWFSFAQDKVPLLTKLYLGQEQFIGFTGQGASFPVLPAKGN